MKTFSIWSFVFIVIGILSYLMNWMIDGYSEPFIFIGFILLIIGAIIGFIAIAKKEKGGAKYIPLVTFFVVLFLVSLYEPFQILRVITWLKNIT